MPRARFFILLLVVTAILLACQYWLGTLNQPLIDDHEFRQTQTALTSLFIEPSLNGILNYETPVLGAPWSIPFEFPLFQLLAARLADISGLSLSASGRLLSVLFGLGCIWPAANLMHRYGLRNLAMGIFTILYLTSSIYLYWNRSFLIESTALFFTLVSLDSYSQLRHKHEDANIYIGLKVSVFAISLSLALLVKATTALPALALMAGDWVWKNKTGLTSRREIGNQLIVGCSMLLAFFMMTWWTHHADALKELNPLGANLTSRALQSWNFGAPSLRWQPELWQGVVVNRMLTPMAALPITAIIAVGTWISTSTTKLFIIACIYLAISPLLIFTSLHITHPYYQTSNQVFLLMAIAGAASSTINLPGKKNIIRLFTIAILAILTASSLLTFKVNYLAASLKTKSEKTLIGNRIQEATPSNSGILVFGDDWSSAFAYHSKRRAFTLPNWKTGLDSSKIMKNPSEYIGDMPLGAIVSRDPISNNALPANCTASIDSYIKTWHFYLCKPLKPTALTNIRSTHKP